MTLTRTDEYLRGLLLELRKLPKEMPWVEFKTNFSAPEDLGEYISALANAAALERKASAYLAWGVDDETHEIVGTTFSPSVSKKGNEELESWLLHSLSPRIHFRFYEFSAGDKPVVLLEIDRAVRQPVQFMGQEYIRIGSYKKKLKDFPEQERELWRIFETIPFESHIAAANLSADDVVKLLDYPAYFDLLSASLPESREGVLDALAAEEMIARNDAGKWDITNLGAILFAKRMGAFRSLKRKAVRVVLYKGNSRIETIREIEGAKGYANGHEGLIDFINNLLPSNEIMGKALRKDVPMYPELAIRELVVNAIIHQDFHVTGAGPLIEIFEDRMEVTNPGKPLVDTNRFLDCPPRSRNEALASFMRRIGVCEERGSGVDKVVFQTELYQLPAPLFEVAGDNTRALLFAHRPLNQMDKQDRIRACYLHACLKFVNREKMTNASLRERFGIDPKNSATASRIIKETVEAGLIRPHDPEMPRKLSKYIPFWG
jgi:predicted HTH transcriptional regulator